MQRWEIAVMSMIAASAAGFVFAEGERSRVQYIRAMKRCVLRMREMIRYEQPSLYTLLMRVDLHASPQERQLCTLLHSMAARMTHCTNPQLVRLFEGECARRPMLGVLSDEDRQAFEALLSELGRTGMAEHLRLMDGAYERLTHRETELVQECAKRMRLMRTLGLTGGAAMFLLLV